MVRLFASALLTLPLASAFFADEGQLVKVEVHLRPGAGSQEVFLADQEALLRGELLVESEARDIERHPLSASGRVDLFLPSGVASRLEIDSGRFWTPPRVVIPVAGGEKVVLEAHAAGTLRGHLQVARLEEVPESIAVTFEPAQSFRVQKPKDLVAPTFPPTTRRCPVKEEGIWECVLPGYRLDLRLRVQGYVSQYRWGVLLEPGSELDIGAVPLKRGASLVGWVRTGDGLPLGSQVEALVEPAAATDAVGRDTVGLPRRKERVPVDLRGFFHFEALAPGSYIVSVEADGYAVASVSPVTVYEGRETSLSEPLLLQRPVTFDLALVPPVDPFGAPWRVSLSPRDSGTAAQFEEAGSDGLWRRLDLAPGEYRLRVESTGSSRRTWHFEDLRVEPGMPVYELRLPLIQIEGTVKLGEEPLEALLRFGGRHGARRIDVHTDEEGGFTGYLTEEGEWPLSVYSAATDWKGLAPVDIEVAPGDSTAHLEIDVPDTWISGEVVDQQGQGVPDAEVSVFHLAQGIEMDQIRTNREGQFESRGLNPGEVAVSARGPNPDTVSTAHRLEVRDGDSTRPIRLVLEKLREIAGRVISSNGPVPGARVSTHPRLPGESFLQQQAQILTDAQGQFSVRLPARAQGLDLTVLAAGFAAEIRHVPAPVPDEITIEVQPYGGTLILDLGALGRAPRVSHEGGLASMLLLRNWARFHGVEDTPERLTLPMMDPGAYTVCASGLPEGEKSCVQGFLPPDGELTLPPR